MGTHHHHIGREYRLSERSVGDCTLQPPVPHPQKRLHPCPSEGSSDAKCNTMRVAQLDRSTSSPAQGKFSVRVTTFPGAVAARYALNLELHRSAATSGHVLCFPVYRLQRSARYSGKSPWCLGTGMEPVVPDPVVVENAGRQFTWMSWSGNMLFITWAT